MAKPGFGPGDFNSSICVLNNLVVLPESLLINAIIEFGKGRVKLVLLDKYEGDIKKKGTLFELGLETRVEMQKQKRGVKE